MSLKLAILASGSGTNAQAIYEAVQRGVLDADIRLVLSNRPGAKVLERAKAWDVPHVCLNHQAYTERVAFDRAMIAKIQAAGADTVALAGYMRLLTSEFLCAFPGRVLNIHPALLPAFKGVSGTAEAQAWGVKLTGCTVHFVSDEMDCGPIIIQACLPVLQDEELNALQNRIHVLEHRIYPQALQWLAQGRLTLHGRQVRLTSPDRLDSPVMAAVPLADVPEPCCIWPPLEAGF